MKTKRSRLGFFSSNPKHTLPLQRGIEQFDNCKLSNGQVSRSSLLVLEDPVDLICSCSSGNESCRLSVHCKESDLIHQKVVVRLVGLTFTYKEVTTFVISMRAAKKVVLCIIKRVISYTTAILIC